MQSLSLSLQNKPALGRALYLRHAALKSAQWHSVVTGEQQRIFTHRT